MKLVLLTIVVAFQMLSFANAQPNLFNPLALNTFNPFLTQQTNQQDNRALVLLGQILTELQTLNDAIRRLLLLAGNTGNRNGFGPEMAAILAATLGRNDDRGSDRPSIIKIPTNSKNSYGRTIENEVNQLYDDLLKSKVNKRNAKLSAYN